MDRRSFLAVAAGVLAPAADAAPTLASAPALRRTIGRHAETLPVIGMGTWLTFDIEDRAAERAQRREVLRRFFAAGGGMIDSSPMYGGAQALLGELLPSVAHDGRLFAATKIWTPIDAVGPRQLDEALRLWRLPRFDLLLVHNLLDWRAHLKLLRAAQAQGRTRYIGVSTSHGRHLDEVLQLLRSEPIDALQITYNLTDTSAEPALNLAAERGVAVVINRPYDGGLLFDRMGPRPLPPWAADAGCANWPEFFLKWVLAHPAVTCAIPATRNPAHMDENMRAGTGRLPAPAERQRMHQYIARA